MGGWFSTSDPPSPPPRKVLDEPWRQINWGNTQDDLQYLNNYKPQRRDLQLRILLHGPVGAGKSSFINSVKSALQGKLCRQVMVDNIGRGCFTKKYTTYKIEKGNRTIFYPFVLNDMMGLKHAGRRNRKIHVKDMKLVMKGKVKDDYTFNPESKIPKNDPCYNNAPTDNDKVHIVVFVIDANTAHLMDSDVVETLCDIRDEATELGIPQVALFTKIDEACREIKTDMKNVYRSKSLQTKIEKFSANVGIPVNCIFPVKNYHSETNLNDDINALILNTLRNIITIADDASNQN
ncbi:interferon-induced protein 44-like [Mugil cephalus]|uniref:interferon-induced protein 44-like n=1 Tax=Mugil cephalus TaxID=48193 RepID=UPI001FB833E8|nr:interferon-induced protein 44-like [Mugil cephalus]